LEFLEQAVTVVTAHACTHTVESPYLRNGAR